MGEDEEARILQMQITGERERLRQEAQLLRTRERELHLKQQQLAQASADEQSKMLFEMREKRHEQAKLRRTQQIEEKRMQAVAKREERERLQKKEKDCRSDYFSPPPLKGRLVPGA